MTIVKKPFGTMPDGTAVSSYIMTSDSGCVAEVLDYGVTIRTLLVPDQDGRLLDVVLGYDTLEEYRANDGYLGATVGRYANRIEKGKFTLNGQDYTLAVNNGPNHLHGGLSGYSDKVWAAEELVNGMRFTRSSPDGEEGYPGTLELQVDVIWAENNALELRYKAYAADADTILNLTNHSYFNLSGHGNVHSHLMQINADSFTINDENCLPNGEIVPVEGTAMDFRTEHAIGERVDSEEPCVKLSKGYDSNFILSGAPAVTVRSEETGIRVTVTTDQPGIQIYSGNFLTKRNGKGGKVYDFRGGLCLETQHYPDSIHHPEWPTCILKKGETFASFTRFTFA